MMTDDNLPVDSLMNERWTNQWVRQLGFTNEQLMKRIEKVEQFSKAILDRIKSKKIADITRREQVLLEALREYEHRLSRTGFENDIQEEFEAMHLRQKESFIEKKHQELDLREEKSIKQMDTLMINQEKLCNLLAMEPLKIIPDESLIKRIERLQNYQKLLEDLMNERTTILKSYQNRLKSLCDQLDFQIDPNSKAYQLFSNEFECCLTTTAIDQISFLLSELDKKSEEQEMQIKALICTIEKLYAKLSNNETSPPKRSAAYILRHNTAQTVKELEKEIAELQAKRMAIGQVYCQSMRKKINELEELCQIGDSERHRIDFDNIQPDTLDQCDMEFDRLENMYKTRRPVLEAFDQYRALNQQRLDFLVKSSSAARFRERGYSAVKEQAERKRFLHTMPKFERMCSTALEQWENDHPNGQFLINDQPIRELLEQINPAVSNTTTTTSSKMISKTISTSSLGTSILPQCPPSKMTNRKKSLRQIVKKSHEHYQSSQTHHEEMNEDTLEFTKLENVKHINGLPRIVTSTPKTGKNNPSHTVVDVGRNKAHDAIQKRRPSKRTIPTRR